MTKPETPTTAAGGSPLERGVGRLEPERDTRTPLKPCPFCLTEGAKLIELWDSFDAGTVAHIHCEHCGADGPSVYGEMGVAPTIFRARSTWNARAVRYEPPNVF